MKNSKLYVLGSGLRACWLGLATTLAACQSPTPTTETLTLKNGIPIEIPLTATFEERTQYFEAMQALTMQIPFKVEGQVPLSFQTFTKRAKKHCKEKDFFATNTPETQTPDSTDVEAILAKHYRELC